MRRLFIFEYMISIEDLYKIYSSSSGISTDTRNIEKGNLFFALKGENFNGNKFAIKALENGASHVVIDDDSFAIDNRYIVVSDTLQILQELAHFHRRELAIPIIAIAGSNGKTTTKELTASVLNTSYKTYFTKGNFNNEIGLPLTILDIKKDAEIAILEMGARKQNDIAFLCEIAEPTHGIITNIGKDHIEFFGSVENTLIANTELFDYLSKNNGTVFINPEHKELMDATKSIDKLIRYGSAPNIEFSGKIEQEHPFLTLSYTHDQEQYFCKSQLVGGYNLENIMAAIAIGSYFKISQKKIITAIETYQPKNNRSQLIEYDSNSIILDAYNANPSSMKLALESFERIVHPKKMVILGDMLELGDTSEEEHLLTILQLKKMHLDTIILVGAEMSKVQHKLDCLHFDNYAALKIWFDQNLPQNYLILVKGSRGISLEKVFIN